MENKPKRKYIQIIALIYFTLSFTILLFLFLIYVFLSFIFNCLFFSANYHFNVKRYCLPFCINLKLKNRLIKRIYMFEIVLEGEKTQTYVL